MYRLVFKFLLFYSLFPNYTFSNLKAVCNKHYAYDNLDNLSEMPKVDLRRNEFGRV